MAESVNRTIAASNGPWAAEDTVVEPGCTSVVSRELKPAASTLLRVSSTAVAEGSVACT